MPDAIDLSVLTGFADNRLDRLSALRDDADALKRLAADPAARTTAFVQTMPILRAQDDALQPYFSLSEAKTLGKALEIVLLGADEIGPVFAVLLDDDFARGPTPEEQAAFLDSRVLILPDRPELQVADLRALGGKKLLPPPVLGVLGQAKAVLHWHENHRYCAQCGAPTETVAAGWRRECPACGAQHFPRTDPVVIMHVVDGDDCLLGRQSRFPSGMYSCLAGFIESGETIEAAVRREIFEEAGVKVGAVTYLASQPWPFPASLMIGCRAQALSRDIVMDHDELEDCRWFKSRITHDDRQDASAIAVRADARGHRPHPARHVA